MKTITVLVTILFVQGSFAGGYWQAVGKGEVGSGSCKPSPAASFLEFVNQVKAAMEDPALKYSVLPSTEKKGFQAIVITVDGSLSPAVWAESQDKCHEGSEAASVKMAVASVASQYPDPTVLTKGKPHKGKAMLAELVSTYNSMWSKNIGADKFSKLLKQHDPRMHKIISQK